MLEGDQTSKMTTKYWIKVVTHCCTSWQREVIFWLFLIWAQTQTSAELQQL